MFVADALSRKSMLVTQLELHVIGFEHIKYLYAHDPTFAIPYVKCLTHTSWERYYIKDDYLMRANKPCIPESSLRLLLLQEAHGGGLMGHFGRDKTFATLSKNYFWPNMFRASPATPSIALHVAKLSQKLNPMVFTCPFPFLINLGTHGDKTRTRGNKYNLTLETARVGIQIGKVTSGVLQHGILQLTPWAQLHRMHRITTMSFALWTMLLTG